MTHQLSVILRIRQYNAIVRHLFSCEIVSGTVSSFEIFLQVVEGQNPIYTLAQHDDLLDPSHDTQVPSLKVFQLALKHLESLFPVCQTTQSY
jgi:HAMP domain-containing protein